MNILKVVLVRTFGEDRKSTLRIQIPQQLFESDERFSRRIEEEMESLSDWTAVRVRCVNRWEGSCDH